MNRDDLERLCSGRTLRDWIAGQVMGRLVIGSPYEWLQFVVLQVYRFMLKPAIWISAAIVALLMLLQGCSSIPSVQACKVFKYERDGQEWSLEAKECRVMQAPIPVGL